MAARIGACWRRGELYVLGDLDRREVIEVQGRSCAERYKATAEIRADRRREGTAQQLKKHAGRGSKESTTEAAPASDPPDADAIPAPGALRQHVAVGSQPGAREFFALLDGLVRTSPVVIDRPRGRAHPVTPEAIYPLDYGYLDGTRSGDGDGIDVFVGTAAGTDVAGILVIADPVKRDAEIKVLLNCSPAEVLVAHQFVRDVLGIGGLLVRRE